MIKKVIGILLVAWSISIHAAEVSVEPKALDMTVVLKGPDGPFKDCRHSDDNGKCSDFTDMTLGRLCTVAAALPDKSASVADQIAHGKLAMKLVDSKNIVLSVDDIKFLKDQIGKLGYNTMAVYQAVRMLDPTVDK